MDIGVFMDAFTKGLKELFTDNLLFVGIQGSHARNEAVASSDIDTVVVLNKCDKKELMIYGGYIDGLQERDLLCGFVSSIDELTGWDPADRAHLILDTVPFFGNLSSICPPVGKKDVEDAVRQGACAVLHAVRHDILFQRDWSMLPGLYKCARFAIRMRHYLETGVYLHAFDTLAGCLTEDERIIVENSSPSTEDDAFFLLSWASRVITTPPLR